MSSIETVAITSVDDEDFHNKTINLLIHNSINGGTHNRSAIICPTKIYCDNLIHDFLTACDKHGIKNVSHNKGRNTIKFNDHEIFLYNARQMERGDCVRGMRFDEMIMMYSPNGEEYQLIAPCTRSPIKVIVKVGYPIAQIDGSSIPQIAVGRGVKIGRMV